MRIQVDEIQKRITRRDDRVFGIINYDKDNAYPQRVQDIVNGSGITKSCIDIYYKFINGRGFEDSNLGKTVIDGERFTFDKLVRKNARDFANYNGFAIHFNYNVLGEITTAAPVPFSYCRLAIDENTKKVNKIAVYPDWTRERDKKIDRNKIDYIDIYNPDPEVIVKQIEAAGGVENYKGQIYYHGEEGGLVYPLAFYDAELEDIETDSQIKLFKYRNISGSFMSQSMVVVYGQKEGSPVATTSAATPARVAQSDRGDQDNQTKQMFKQFQGAKNFNRLMLVEIDHPDQAPKILPFEHQNNDKLFEFHEKSVQDNIRKVFNIPTIFIEAIAGTLGLSKQLEDAVTYYNKITKDERAVLEEAYQMVFSEFMPGANFNIAELSMFDVAEVDIEEEARQKIANAQAELRGSVGGVTALIQLQQSIAAGTTSVPAGIAMLRHIYGFSEEAANEMLQGVTKTAL